MKIRIDTKDLIQAGILDQDTANQIEQYYHQRAPIGNNRLFTAFGILGGLLVGAGGILLIAHNWESLGRGVQTSFAFIPLLIAQLLSLYAIVRKPDLMGWREGAATALFCAVGSSIALVGQIYNLPGSMESYLLTWMLLCIPMVYVMRSSMLSLLCIGGAVYYGCIVGYEFDREQMTWGFWGMMAALLPYYLWQIRDRFNSNFTVFHHWFWALAVMIMIATIPPISGWTVAVYLFAVGIFHLIGHLPIFEQTLIRSNAYRVVGSIGTWILLFIGCASEFWGPNHGWTHRWDAENIPVWLTIGALSLLWAGILYVIYRKQGVREIPILAATIIPSFLAYLFLLEVPFMHWIMSAMVLAVGIAYTLKGARENHLLTMNYGLVSIAILVGIRFFDDSLSFILKGLLFLGVGIGFFVANYRMIKTPKHHEAK
ncbi:DUF2157 domain-containing protein [Pontibacter sp. G13]|uniref:DUF2157 domain-containing protein n=1 Tax=Pontibacter sp. G13 TaxID=3074898 RepID=UPI00288A0286|nr:DUF2157 domain-containing protein [Pontibacter sp. G13]WNJ17634.1 DUF2157 domain-containing protein [Pontibacter sp. G13]